MAGGKGTSHFVSSLSSMSATHKKVVITAALEEQNKELHIL